MYSLSSIEHAVQIFYFYYALYFIHLLTCQFSSTRIMFYKERSKVMYSCQFWFLYSRSLICTLLFVQSFLKLKFRFSRSFKEFFFINMFIRKNLHYIYSLLKTGNITNYNRIIIRRIKCIFSYILAIFL